MLNLCNFTLYIVDWEGARSLTLSIIKPSVTKKVNAKIGDTINLADLVTGMPENTTNKINYVISSGKKKAQLDSTNNTLTLLNKGTTKVAVTITNNQGKSVKYTCSIKIKKKVLIKMGPGNIAGAFS